jgi:hypothetical protein
MKIIQPVLFACSLLFSATITLGFGQTDKEIIERTWKGSSVQDADFTESGKAYLSSEMNLVLHSDNSVTGVGTSSIVLDGVTYQSKSYMNGHFYPENNELHVEDGSTINSDELPYGLRWCKGSAVLTLYRDQDRYGHYILRGTSTDDCGGSSEHEFVDE